jgi:hypothetical protein
VWDTFLDRNTKILVQRDKPVIVRGLVEETCTEPPQRPGEGAARPRRALSTWPQAAGRREHRVDFGNPLGQSLRRRVQRPTPRTGRQQAHWESRRTRTRRALRPLPCPSNGPVSGRSEQREPRPCPLGSSACWSQSGRALPLPSLDAPARRILSGDAPGAHHHGASPQVSPDARPVGAGKPASFGAPALSANRVMASRTVASSRWASVRALASLGPVREAR